MNKEIITIKYPNSVEEVKDYDQAYTIIVTKSANEELINNLHNIGFYYIFVTEDEDSTSVEEEINKLKEQIACMPDQYYEIESFNYKYQEIVKNEKLPATLTAYDKLLTSIKDMSKEEFLKVVKYSLDDLIESKDIMKKFIELASDDTSYTLLYNKLILKHEDLLKDAAALEIKCSKLEVQNKELQLIPELQEKLKNAEDENKGLYNRINELEATKSTSNIDESEISDLKFANSNLKEQVARLTAENNEYRATLADKTKKDSTSKDAIIASLKEELQKKANNTNNSNNISDYLPIITPKNLSLPNLVDVLYIKEVREMSYFDCLMRYIILSKATSSRDTLVLVYDKLDNEFTKSKYSSKENNFFSQTHLNIHITNDLSLAFLKGINITQFKKILVFDRLGVGNDVMEGYSCIRKYYTVKSINDIQQFSIPPEYCLREFLYPAELNSYDPATFNSASKTGYPIYNSGYSLDVGSKNYRLRSVTFKDNINVFTSNLLLPILK